MKNRRDNDESLSPKIILLERDNDDDLSAMRISGLDKWIVASVIAIVFFILALPFTYRLTNRATSYIGSGTCRLNTVNAYGSPTVTGVLIHTIIFVIVVRLLMH